jgi:putative transcriptional regulator
MTSQKPAAPTPQPGQLANQIRLLRFMHGEMTQAELGERIGLTRQTVAAIEAGKYSPSLEAAFRIAAVFNVPLDQVFQWQLADTT